MTDQIHFWQNPKLAGSDNNNADDNDYQWTQIDCLCIGTGRFLRSVLAPILAHGRGPLATALVQPRGRSFMEFMKDNWGMYPIDTVTTQTDEQGQEVVETNHVSIGAAFSWGQEKDRQAFYEQLPKFKGLQLIGVGITEAGLASKDTPVMQRFFEFVKVLSELYDTEWKDTVNDSNKICILNTDNLPGNGSLLQQHVLALCQEQELDTVAQFTRDRLVFCDSMVDRIVSQRDEAGLVPRAEPIPPKALVLLDTSRALPSWFVDLASTSETKQPWGLVIRNTPEQLQADVTLKLCIANATHTAAAHLLALQGMANTTELAAATSSNDDKKNATTATLTLQLLDHLAKGQIVPATVATLQNVTTSAEIEQAWWDWKVRLTHPTFGLSTFFITQNGAAKGGIRWGPTLTKLLELADNKGSESNNTTTVSFAFCFAVLLRWLTPSPSSLSSNNGVYRGWLVSSVEQETTETVTYADGMKYNLGEGWYEFKCDCVIQQQEDTQQLTDALAKLSSSLDTTAVVPVIRGYLLSPQGGNLSPAAASLSNMEPFCQALAALYVRLVAGDSPTTILQEMEQQQSAFETSGFATPCTELV